MAGYAASSSRAILRSSLKLPRPRSERPAPHVRLPSRQAWQCCLDPSRSTCIHAMNEHESRIKWRSLDHTAARRRASGPAHPCDDHHRDDPRRPAPAHDGVETLVGRWVQHAARKVCGAWPSSSSPARRCPTAPGAERGQRASGAVPKRPRRDVQDNTIAEPMASALLVRGIQCGLPRDGPSTPVAWSARSSHRRCSRHP